MTDFYSLNKIQLTNYRNIKNQVIEFGPKITCIFGDNGNGKSNILESIYFLFNKKSFKKNTGYPQMLSLDCENPEILIQSVIKSEEGKLHSYNLKLKHGEFEYYLDSKLVKKRLHIPTVFINPFDAQSYFQISQFRRQWFDQHFSQFDERYRRLLSKYKDYLKFKNALIINRPHQFREQILAANYSIAPIILELSLIKKEIIAMLNNEIKKIFFKIFADDMNLELLLESSLSIQNSEEILLKLNDSLNKELIVNKTIIGPHRDDYLLLINGLNACDYSSLGQQKSSYLSLLFAYIQLFRYKFKASPIVLMDDVSGELDSLRWSHLTAFLKSGDYQVVLTTANENFRNEVEKFEGVMRLKIINGVVIF